ncbi:MAG: hypothetical protein ABFD81_05260 [Syntrophaceae bacterium]
MSKSAPPVAGIVAPLVYAAAAGALKIKIQEHRPLTIENSVIGGLSSLLFSPLKRAAV